MIIEVQASGLSATAPAIGALAEDLLSAVGPFGAACDSAAGAAGHPAVQGAIDNFLAAGSPALSNLSALEQATSERLSRAAFSYEANDESVMGAGRFGP